MRLEYFLLFQLNLMPLNKLSYSKYYNLTLSYCSITNNGLISQREEILKIGSIIKSMSEEGRDKFVA